MRKKLSDKWFFGDVPFWMKVLQIFIKGDFIVIFPLVFCILLLYFIDRYWMIVALLVFLTLRQIGEMFYWILQQFFNTGYRPFDFGFTRLSNKAVYIIYQLLTLATATLSFTALLYILFG